MSQHRKEEKDPIPDVIVDPGTQKRYSKGRFLGKGGFGRCFEFTDDETNAIYAGKIISKSMLIKEHHRQKMTQEIEIHRSISHKHIVKFHKFFEDDSFVYILLELCRRRSMMELQKRRKAITEAECRYFVRQIALACDFLHKARIIHRDLKLGNLFINDEMEIKIGDFGLATRLDYVGERKRTLCGTPNYIAPEVLNKRGHSYEVDSWSLGCIIYTLLTGAPPFETMSLKDTYNKIRRNDYEIPSRISSAARVLIRKLLQPDPTSRPTMEQVLADEFLTTGVMPNALPTSSLVTAPRFDQMNLGAEKGKSDSDGGRKPLLDCNGSSSASSNAVKSSERPATARPDHKKGPEIDQPADCYLSDLFAQLTSVTSANPSERQEIAVGEAEDPAAIPIYWISKWVDYSDKYGLGYQLCDNSVGVLFNDNTRLILTMQGENLQYIEKDGQEHFHTYKAFPESLTKKMTLLKYFRNYMTEHLLKAGENMAPREGDEMMRLPFLRTWYRTRSAIVLHLSNGTLQINFFSDHTKIILCPLMGAVTYIDETRQAHTYRFALIEKYGCSEELEMRLKYALSMVEKLLTARHSSSSNALVTKRQE